MNSLNNLAFIYYSSISIIALSTISLLIVWLSWPILASSVLGAALFLHILNIAKHAREKFLKSSMDENSFDLTEKVKIVLGIPVTSKSDSEA